jgi:hypothetical protein
MTRGLSDLEMRTCLLLFAVGCAYGVSKTRNKILTGFAMKSSPA